VRLLAVRRNSFSPADFVPLRDALLASPLVGATTLDGPFEASRGFAVTFTAAGRSALLERVPRLGPYLDAVLEKPALRAMTPWFTRLGPVPNAWYLNVLLVPPGATVGRHVDATLRAPAGVEGAVPELVSVLYLKVPEAPGGELRLWAGDELYAELAPEEGMVLHFRGNLGHEVLAFEGAPGALRASLVIEQYHFHQAALARLPDFKLDSRAGFEARLREHAARPPRSFELD